MTHHPHSLRRSSLAVALLVAAMSVAGLARPGAASAWDSGDFSSSSERELVALTNRSRASAGLRSLKVDSTLTSVARWRSKDMIERDYFSHDIPGYGDVFKRLDAKGYCYQLAGENIGWNTYPDGEATSAIHRMFMDSSGHRKNILGKAWNAIGVGAYKGPGGKKMWTVLLADECGSSAPRATPKPKPKPDAKPRSAATAKPTPKPTPEPTPKPTATPTPTPTPVPTPPPAGLRRPDDASGIGHAPAGPGDGTARVTTDSGLRVVTEPPSGGLVESIVGGVAGLFFGA